MNQLHLGAEHQIPAVPHLAQDQHQAQAPNLHNQIQAVFAQANAMLIDLSNQIKALAHWNIWAQPQQILQLPQNLEAQVQAFAIANEHLHQVDFQAILAQNQPPVRPQFNSFSSALMFGSTLYRNQSGIINKVSGQIGYALISIISLTEIAVATAFTALSLIVYPYSDAPFNHSATWLGSSAFSLNWSIAYFCLNPFINKLVADEKHAWELIKNRNILIPIGEAWV